MLAFVCVTAARPCFFGELARGTFRKIDRIHHLTEPAVRETFGEGKGLVLYEACFLREVIDETTQERKQELRVSYAGYLYGVKEEYLVAAKENNQTMLKVTTAAGGVIDYPLLNYDMDGDEGYESNASLQENGFLLIELDEPTFPSVTKLDFYDKDGNLFRSFNLALTFDGTFFADARPFAEEYNAGMTAERFTEADAAFRGKNGNYLMGSVDDYRSKSIVTACVLIGVYFLLVYALYDVLLGRKFIVRGVKWLLQKLFRIDFAKREEEKRLKEAGDRIIGTDYFSRVTFSLDLSEVPDFRETVTVRYTSDEHGDVEFLLLPAEGYTAAKRIHAGVYVNPWIELDRAYEAENFPANLVVEGYQMDVKIKIIERAGTTL